jgi:hypothetical protein
MRCADLHLCRSLAHPHFQQEGFLGASDTPADQWCSSKKRRSAEKFRNFFYHGLIAQPGGGRF